MMKDEVKPWMCPSKRHILGQVTENGSHVRRLLLYRHAVDAEGEAGEVEVMAVVEGYVTDVKCDICGRVRTWMPGEEAIRAVVARVRKMRT